MTQTKAQTNFDFEIPWSSPTSLKNNGQTVLAPTILNQELDNGKPIFFWKKQLKTKNYVIDVTSFEHTIAPKEDITYLNLFDFKVSDSLSIESKVTNSYYEHYAVVHLFPYIRIGSQIHRITRVSLKLKEISKPTLTEKDFVTTSALREGTGIWYKISVTKDGIYKLDKSFFEKCGLSIDNINPMHVNIFGNGDGKLPELNSVPRTDDLAKNAIYFFGESDGVFNDNDYLLFYGWGPDRWIANGTSNFDRDKNIYSDNSYYFININPTETPLRISSIPSSSTPVTNIVDSYSHFDVYENDWVNLVSGGQRWYGELFDVELDKTFNFYVPDIEASSPATFKTYIATNTTSSSGTKQQYAVNGTVLFSDVLPSISSDFVQSVNSMSLLNPTSSIPFRISITRNNPSTLVYLDRIVMNARRKLKMINSQFNFRDFSSTGSGNISEFQITGLPTSGFVWEITNRQVPQKVTIENSGAYSFFRLETDELREFVASSGTSFDTPEPVGIISPQNLHGLPQADMLIVTHQSFIGQANRLADLHRDEGLKVHVVTTEQVFNEFSSGMLDPTAIRMFAKMFYDRAVNNPTTAPKYLLLFGDGTFDPKGRVSNNNNFVPTYQFENSENHISSMVSDDYYGMLDVNEAIAATDLLDIGIGRLLISDNTMAKQQVDKIEHYMKNGSMLFSGGSSNTACAVNGQRSTFGDWRLVFTQIADDEEGGYFVNQDTEPQYIEVKSSNPEMNCDKIYCDAYMQESTAGGQRYPDVYDAITNRVERGSLIVNYVGHGGEVGLAEERIVTVPQIQSWKNIDHLNLFVSATCEFTKFDDPARVSAGEWLSLNPDGGSIALMTTTRSVFFGVNTITGQRFYENVFVRDSNFKPKTFGEIIQKTKNESGSSENKRSFTLIGDPALRIALPLMKIVTDSINGKNPDLFQDTIRGLSKMIVKGHLEDYNGTILNSFNGFLFPSILDKIKVQQTLGQDSDSPVIPFEIQKNYIYKGKTTISSGYFKFECIIPKDINYTYGSGKISYYANSSTSDAYGYDNRFVIGGIDPKGINDNTGPQIDLYLNDESFVSGGLTDETPILIAKLFDENGINTVGNGIGHDLTAILDEQTSKPIVLNEFYTANTDSYQAGVVTYSFPPIEKGKHKLTLKVWDVNNNSSEASIEFNVKDKEKIELSHVLNYPNPFTTHTEFFFEHNQVCSVLEAQIKIFTISGRLVKTINEYVNTEGFRSAGIPWDGKDDFGDQLAKGVYVYSIQVTTQSGEKAEKIEKLVLLR